MEVLNNIWIAISTPNEGLVNILVSLATFVENYLVMSLFISILNIKASIKQKSSYVLSMSIISIISMHLISNPFNIFFNYLLMIILAKIIFKLTLIKSILSTISSSVFFALVGSLLLNPFLH